MNHFNIVANSWDTPEKIDQYKMYANKIKSALNKYEFENVLEIGCGTGLLSSNFIENNSFLGLDTSEGMLEVFTQKFKDYPKVKCLQLNIEESHLEKVEEKFDLIISSMAFHHLKHPELMLKKLKPYLAPDGAVAIIDLDEEDGSFHPDPKNMGVHHFGFSKEKTQAWVKACEFKKIHYEIIYSIDKDQKSYPIFLILLS